jgi:hypothetical protein
VATRVEAEGLRPVARAIGMDPHSVLKFLAGSKPRASTRQKLERWFAQQREGVVDPDAARAALHVLLQDLAPGERDQAFAGALAAFHAIYARSRTPPPPWLQLLTKGPRQEGST